LRYGSGLSGAPEFQTSVISPSAPTLPIRAVLWMCCVGPSTVTVPSGASNVTPSAAALTFSTSNEPAFSTIAFHRWTETYAASIGSLVGLSAPYFAL
jgi:hypothetical protein